MSKPTDAQIEAIPTQIAWLRELAQRGGKGTVDGLDARSLGRIADTLAALTAAAAVGKNHLSKEPGGNEFRVLRAASDVDMAVAATIERCATAFEPALREWFKMILRGPNGEMGVFERDLPDLIAVIAAAIRALRDKP